MFLFQNSFLLILFFLIATACLFFAFKDYLVIFLADLISKIINYCDYFFLYLSSLAVVACFAIALSPLGKKRLGSKPPNISLSSWLFMLFAAGMGSGLMFWGVAEPLVHLDFVKDLSISSLHSDYSMALAATYFNWGLHAWSIYLLSGLILAYFSFNKSESLSSSKKIFSFSAASSMNLQSKSYLYFLVNLITVLAVVFGLVGTLANALDLSSHGISTYFIPSTVLSQDNLKFILLLITSILFSVSSFLGLKRGIMALSRINCLIFFSIFLFVFLFTDVKTFFTTLLYSLLDYANFLLHYSFYIPSNLKDWFDNWSVNYFIWWLAWSPFVGSFIALISYGRTIRQFLLLGITIPVLVSIFWFCAFASVANSYEAIAGLKSSLSLHYTQPLFEFFEMLPVTHFLYFIAISLLIMFVVTSVDSAIYVLCFLSGGQEKAKYQRLIWSTVFILLTASLIYFNDLELNRQIAIVGAIPYSIIFCINFLIFIKHSLFSKKK